MQTLFTTKVKYEKTMENGLVKKTTECYIFEAANHGDAEELTVKEMSPFISGEFQVKAVAIAKYAEIVQAYDETADRWYKVRYAMITLDEKSGAEKKTKVDVLVQAEDLRNATKRFDEYMKGTMCDYDIVSVSNTNIQDVYLLEESEVSNG